MDSLTQIALGAAVGEATLGRKVGNKAILWGALAGTIPDLDIIAYPFLDEVTKLSWHRGYSHSLVFAIIFAPVLGWLISKIHKKSEATWKEWSLLFFLGLFTHCLLDSFTTYGTQLFLPLSNTRVAWNSIFVVDPFYTAPLLIPLIILMFYKSTSQKRRVLNYIGLTISSLYLLLTVVNKFYVNSKFETEMANETIRYERYMTSPTPFNNILWRVLAKEGDSFWVGYYSLMDNSKQIVFNRMPQNKYLLESIRDKHALKMLKWFSNGYYSVSEINDEIQFNDLRFGEFTAPSSINGLSMGNFGLDHPEKFQYIFSFKLMNGGEGDNSGLNIERIRPSIENAGIVLKQLITRIRGL
jgi:inner membrane protein